MKTASLSFICCHFLTTRQLSNKTQQTEGLSPGFAEIFINRLGARNSRCPNMSHQGFSSPSGRARPPKAPRLGPPHGCPPALLRMLPLLSVLLSKRGHALSSSGAEESPILSARAAPGISPTGSGPGCPMAHGMSKSCFPIPSSTLLAAPGWTTA